ncbi:hypothetical protein ARMGADRAFT_1032060 [Armillaria gallica]|uniref:Uncharacterized protein n=1 Tax=Armillaria gallica TaxID=47427 RepID=A0A2H3DU37_ARMGA|nr:hypothetical protein ARMGADRAFT_1032060 [Armillaria gallica]
MPDIRVGKRAGWYGGPQCWESKGWVAVGTEAIQLSFDSCKDKWGILIVGRWHPNFHPALLPALFNPIQHSPVKTATTVGFPTVKNRGWMSNGDCIVVMGYRMGWGWGLGVVIVLGIESGIGEGNELEDHVPPCQK